MSTRKDAGTSDCVTVLSGWSGLKWEVKLVKYVFMDSTRCRQVGLSEDNSWWCHESREDRQPIDLTSFHHFDELPCFNLPTDVTLFNTVLYFTKCFYFFICKQYRADWQGQIYCNSISIIYYSFDAGGALVFFFMKLQLLVGNAEKSIKLILYFSDMK